MSEPARAILSNSSNGSPSTPRAGNNPSANAEAHQAAHPKMREYVQCPRHPHLHANCFRINTLTCRRPVSIFTRDIANTD
eukprot:5686500-Pyramimonas_sp.AAC.1